MQSLNNMDNLDNWQCPNNWHVDCDGAWEIDKLKCLGAALSKYDKSLRLELDLETPECIFFRAFRGGQKLGEAYVNRKQALSDDALYSVFYNLDEESYHSSSILECVAKLIHSNGFPPDTSKPEANSSSDER